MINSYDIFDTLIGRICYNGKDIFSIIERLKNIKNFCYNRIKFESQSKDFDKTYILLENHYHKNMSDIKQLELDLEYELSFPIVKYLNIVKKEDILVSDMYLNEEQIRKLLNKHINIDNKLYVTYGGKKNNTIWKDIINFNNIICHYGDNIVSDYNNPKKNNIEAFHISDTVLNLTEKKLLSINKYISYICRAVRLSYASSEKLWNIFINYSLPFAILVCLKIKQLTIKNNLNSIVFLSRDGYWFKEIYDIMYPTDYTHYVYFSRLYVSNNRNNVINEINNIHGKKFIFDLQGSGRTFHSLNLQNCFYFMCFLSRDSKIPNYLYKHSNQLCNIKEIIESLFMAPHGSVYTYDNNMGKINLLEPEHDIKLFNPYFKGLQLFKKYWNTMKKYCNFDINYENLDNTINHFHDNIEYQITLKNEIKSLINHVNIHSLSYTKIPTKFYSQIEQDKYFIENIIKYRPNGLFLEIGGYDGITGSNTYFLEKNLGWNGIIVECNPTLVEKCKNTRSCYICDKALYESDNAELLFTIPCGDEIIGGKEQLGGIKTLLKPESLRVFQRCYKESKDIIVKTININTLLESRKIYSIDYVSLDVEGGELSILKTWDFNKHKVRFLTVEHGNIAHYQKSINILLTSKGFVLHRNNKWDDEYIYI